MQLRDKCSRSGGTNETIFVLRIEQLFDPDPGPDPPCAY